MKTKVKITVLIFVFTNRFLDSKILKAKRKFSRNKEKFLALRNPFFLASIRYLKEVKYLL